MTERMKMKDIYKNIYRKTLDNDGKPRAEVASLFLFFNTFLKKKATLAQLADRIVQRFFAEWSANSHSKLKTLFETHSQNDDVVETLTQSFLALGASLDQIRQVVNPKYISQLRILCIPKSHVIDTSLLRDTLYKLLIERGNLRADVVNSFLNLDVLEVYKEAFTHISISPEHNYELWETLGDGIAKGFLRFYAVRRFPEIAESSRSSETLTNIGKNYESMGYFSVMYDYLNLQQVSAYREELIHIHPKHSIDREHGDFVMIDLTKSIKEDILEAFFGVTQYLIDGKIQLGMGNAICYNIFSSLFDEQELETDVRKLENPVTKLKEIFDKAHYMYDVVPGKKPIKLDLHRYYEKEFLEDGAGLNTGKVRMKLEMIFNVDPMNQRRNLIKKFVVTQRIVEALWSDWFENPDDAKKDVAEKALALLGEKYDLFWKKGSNN
jgi:dsRNA-specific ribonuclease